MLNDEIKTYIHRSVLCWLGTSGSENIPNVSPKEIFTYADDYTILIANIASPESAKNIRQNPNVCVSFIDIFVQKGFKTVGTARIIDKENTLFKDYLAMLKNKGDFSFDVKNIIEVTVIKTGRILAPSYHFRPGTTEEMQINNALETYKVRKADTWD